jgi:hypothetical protein
MWVGVGRWVLKFLVLRITTVCTGTISDIAMHLVVSISVAVAIVLKNDLFGETLSDGD